MFEKVSGWGGKRRGAGRPNRSGKQGHAARKRVKKSIPMHLTWKLKKGVVNLRTGKVSRLFKTCAKAVQIFGFRIVHFSLQFDHIHMIVEAEDNKTLAQGMRSFGCRFAKGIRAIAGGRGSIFADRYHLQLLETPTQMRNALAYVLQNFSKHSKLLNHVDEFSSAAYFFEWKKLLGRKMGPILESLEGLRPPLPDYLCAARTWMAREGWTRAPVA